MFDNTYALNKIRQEASLQKPLGDSTVIWNGLWSFFYNASNEKNTSNYYTSIYGLDHNAKPDITLFNGDTTKLVLQRDNSGQEILLHYIRASNPLLVRTIRRNTSHLTDLKGAMPLTGKSTENPKFIAKIVEIFCPTNDKSFTKTSQSETIRRAKI